MQTSVWKRMTSLERRQLHGGTVRGKSVSVCPIVFSILKAASRIRAYAIVCRRSLSRVMLLLDISCYCSCVDPPRCVCAYCTRMRHPAKYPSVQNLARCRTPLLNALHAPRISI